MTYTRCSGLLTGNSSLETLYEFDSFPVFMGCVDHPLEEDVFKPMAWDICKKTGLIQLRSPLPCELVYQNQHNDGVGLVWQKHYDSFVSFLSNFSLKTILEIGGAGGIIAEKYLSLFPGASWTMIEPNPSVSKDLPIKIIPNWFDEAIVLDRLYPAIIHSHVFEHVYDPVSFLKLVNQHLVMGGYHCFSIPNLSEFLKNCYTNCLNFEHTYFLSEDIADSLIENTGFEIIKKESYSKHSIFYATKKIKRLVDKDLVKLEFPCYYAEYKLLFNRFISYHIEMVNELNIQIEAYGGPIYLFGAHIFALYLFAFGLESKKIQGVLDNSKLKQGKRLYGTRFVVESPECLREKEGAVVILKAAQYNQEIKDQILGTINATVSFW